MYRDPAVMMTLEDISLMRIYWLEMDTAKGEHAACGDEKRGHFGLCPHCGLPLRCGNLGILKEEKIEYCC